ncbi:MAG: nuclear transport factor 2 family protein [Planctomycetes bacterium]|nr:nuclear transport factor 2 family protein [Planctomycetota bacterium]
MTLRLALLLSALLLSACASTAKSGAGDTYDYPAIVREVLQKGLVEGDEAVIEKYVAADYIQHNPHAEDGRAGLIKFVREMQKAPAEQRITIKVVRLFQDGEFVVAHSDVWLGAPLAVFDVWRVRDGMLVEHWDCMQPQPEESVNGHSMLDGATAIADKGKTDANKKLVRAFVESVLGRGEVDKIDDYIGDEYTQHNPNVADGKDALRNHIAAMRTRGAKFSYEPVRVIGAGNFVLVQAEAIRNGRDIVINDLFRVQAGKIVEHWDTIQEVPLESANSNGMLP